MPPRSKGRTGRPWLRIRRQILAQGRPCWLCGQDIDPSLPRQHPWSFTVDHIQPLSRGGSARDLDNLAPAHARCNSRRGSRVRVQPLITSRRW